MNEQYVPELEKVLMALERGDFEVNYPHEKIAVDGTLVIRVTMGEKPYLTFAGMHGSSLAAHIREHISIVRHLTFNLEAARKEVDLLKHLLHHENVAGMPDDRKPTHVDDWLDYGRFRTDSERYARFVINYFRMPASQQFDFHDWMKQFKLFCTYEGKRYRVTGASRLGDIWLARDPDQETGYDLRVSVDACSRWSNEPAEGQG